MQRHVRDFARGRDGADVACTIYPQLQRRIEHLPITRSRMFKMPPLPTARLASRPRVQSRPPAPAAGIAHQARITEGLEVPRDRLARHAGALAETHNRQRPLLKTLHGITYLDQEYDTPAYSRLIAQV
jgi:hypothetical protein